MKYLFYVAKKYSIPIVQPLRDLLEQTGEDYALFVSEKVRRSLSSDWNPKRIITDIDEAIAFKPDFALAPGNFIDFRISGIKVQIFHGLGVEKESHYKIRHFFDVYLTSGPLVTERFKQLQHKYKSFIVLETGWPKVDYILNYAQDSLREKYDIPEDKKVILYAPTFSRKMQSASDLLTFIPEIIREDEVWILKFHELMNKEITETLQNRANNQIRIIDTFDITPLLYLADCMLSDTSSVLYEFLSLKKPVVTYRTLSRPEKGINILNQSQLRGALDEALEKGVTSENMRCLEEVNPYLKYEISENVFKQLARVKEENLLEGKRKRWNLFRKLQVLFHAKFKKGYLR